MEEAANFEENVDAWGALARTGAKFREPAEDLEIAEATGGVFYVGFEVVESVLEAGVALVGEFGDIAAEFGFGVADLAEEGFIAGEKAAVQKTNGEFCVSGIDLVAVEGCVDGLGDAEFLVPEVAETEREGFLNNGLG